MKQLLTKKIVLIFSAALFHVVNGAPDFSLVGFAAGVTGGAGGRMVKVSTSAEFKSNCQSDEKLIIEVTGKIDKASTSISSNKTIIGVGTSGELTATTISISSGTNIIIRNLKIHHAEKEKDLISISGGKNIWIDHCDIYNSIGDLNGDGKIDTEGDIEGGDVDWYDGLIDMTKTSANITISWNKIHDSFKAMLVGSSDSDDDDRKITIHHNHFYKLWERVPSYRSGTGHIFNNYFSDIQHSAVNSRMNAQLRIEGNVFETVGSGDVDSKTKIEWGPVGAYYSGTKGLWDVKDNLFINCKGNQPDSSTCSFTPQYEYTKVLDAASAVKPIVTTWAGVGTYNSTVKINGNRQIPVKKLSITGKNTSALYNCQGKKMNYYDNSAGRTAGVYFIKDANAVCSYLKILH